MDEAVEYFMGIACSCLVAGSKVDHMLGCCCGQQLSAVPSEAQQRVGISRHPLSMSLYGPTT
jgi:hypothetical protein